MPTEKATPAPYRTITRGAWHALTASLQTPATLAGRAAAGRSTPCSHEPPCGIFAPDPEQAGARVFVLTEHWFGASFSTCGHAAPACVR